VRWSSPLDPRLTSTLDDLMVRGRMQGTGVIRLSALQHRDSEVFSWSSLAYSRDQETIFTPPPEAYAPLVEFCFFSARTDQDPPAIPPPSVQTL